METGLFQTHLVPAVLKVKQLVDRMPIPDVQFQHALPISNFLFTSFFVVYFALYKAKSVKNNCILLCLRLVAMFFYAPLLCYFQLYVDAVLVFVVLYIRLMYVVYWSCRYRTFAFIVLNTDKLAFVQGYYWYYNDTSYITLQGGENFLVLGTKLVPFALAHDIYIALRGKKDEDVPLVRRVELINGQFFYIFAQEPVVGVVNMSFSEIRLCEDVEISTQ
uniref:NS3 n=1 Tax=Hipposideros bat coronavirus TaxID=2913380 RepID=A0AAT9T6K8_9NIDO|nr:MAG: NS3 [Hipposideros bat coronavirus]